MKNLILNVAIATLTTLMTIVQAETIQCLDISNKANAVSLSLVQMQRHLQAQFEQITSDIKLKAKQATVAAEFQVDADGQPINISTNPTSPEPSLEYAAIRAIKEMAPYRAPLHCYKITFTYVATESPTDGDNNEPPYRASKTINLSMTGTTPKPASVSRNTTGNPIIPVPKTAEIHVVSGYEPKSTLTQVIVDRPGKQVVLILTAYEKVVWNIKATKSTQILAVLTSGYHKQYVQSVTPNLIKTVQLPYAVNEENSNFRTILEFVQSNLNHSSLSSFNGHYQIPESVFINHVDTTNAKISMSYPSVSPSPTGLSFYLESARGKVKWTPSGPFNSSNLSVLAPKRQAITPDGQYQFSIASNGITITNLHNMSSQYYEVPPLFPDFSWAQGIAYSPASKTVVIGSLGGEGFFYRFDFSKRRWLDYRSMDNRLDIQNLQYDKYTGHYLGFSTIPNCLFELSSDGNLIKTWNVGKNLPGYLSTYDSGNAMAPPLFIIPVSSQYLALLQFQSGMVRHIWLLDKITGNALLTYKSKSTPNTSTQIPSAPRMIAGQPTPRAISQNDIDFGPYVAELRRRIRRNWSPPVEDRDKRVVALFHISRDGRLLGLSIQQSSGSPPADQAAISAIRASSPFRSLPPTFHGNDIAVQFIFDYSESGHGSVMMR